MRTMLWPSGDGQGMGSLSHRLTPRVTLVQPVLGPHLKKSALTDWPTKQAEETKRMRKKVRSRIEEMLGRCEKAQAAV